MIIIHLHVWEILNSQIFHSYLMNEIKYQWQRLTTVLGKWYRLLRSVFVRTIINKGRGMIYYFVAFGSVDLAVADESLIDCY